MDECGEGEGGLKGREAEGDEVRAGVELQLEPEGLPGREGNNR